MAHKVKLAISGENVRPETVDMADLIDILKAFRSAVYATARERGHREDKIQMSLVSIQGGSSVMELDTDDQTEAQFDRIITAIKTHDPTLLSYKAREHIDILAKKAHARSWTIGLYGSANQAAIITPDALLFTPPVIRGNTSLVIHLIRVGGEEQSTATIRVPDGQKLTADIASPRLAQELGTMLYQDIEVCGEATWASRTYKLLEFKITGVGTYKESESDPIRAIEKLSVLSRGIWDNVDPRQYVADIRAD